MKAEPVEAIVRAIRESANGNKGLAQRLLVARALEDDQLLKHLVAPFLKAIALKWVEQGGAGGASGVTTSSGERGAEPPAAPLTPPKPGRRPLTEVRSPYNPMRAADPPDSLGPRPAASLRHVSTLKLLAAAYAVKRGEG